VATTCQKIQVLSDLSIKGTLLQAKQFFLKITRAVLRAVVYCK